MDAVKFIEERNRMCNSFDKYCYGCPAWDGSCKLGTGTYLKCEAAKQVEIVEEWSAAHPRKTRQSVFLEQYPNAVLDKDGVLRICPFSVGGDIPKKYKCICLTDCSACRREFWMQEVE
jgi:hypothetical protein